MSDEFDAGWVEAQSEAVNRLTRLRDRKIRHRQREKYVQLGIEQALREISREAQPARRGRARSLT
jgi:hypothetical protein